MANVLRTPRQQSRAVRALEKLIVRAREFGSLPPAVLYVVGGIALNIPFVLFHPGHLIIGAPLLRSLVINLILFAVPGLPLLAVLIRIGWLQRFELIWLIVLSFLSFAFVLVSLHAVGVPLSAGVMWNGEWLVTNLGLLANVLGGGPPTLVGVIKGKALGRFMVFFVVAYLMLFYGATRVVPVLGDQDDEVQGTAYGLMTRLKPSLATGRGTQYMFAHPPLLHVYVAGSLLYFNLLDRLVVYDSQSPYHLDPPAAYRHYTEHPYLLETRTPNLFFAALTVAVLGCWVARMSSRWWLGALVGFVYVSCPEVFVRSSYAGYFGVDNFFLLQMLLAVEGRLSNPGRFSWNTCLLAGTVAALADHKMVLLPASLVMWEVLRATGRSLRKVATAAIGHPIVLGFALGTAVFWAYGLSVSPADFWTDHVRHHLVDRVIHRNARGLDMSKYPGVVALWVEFFRHTGYVLVPLGGAALGLLCSTRAPNDDRDGEKPVAGWRTTSGLWTIWAVATAIAFSSIDWRQTKHLASLTLPLFLAVGRVGLTPALRLAILVLLFGLLIWNLSMLYALAGDFGVLKTVPEW